MDNRQSSNEKGTGIGNVLRSLRIIRDLTVKELADKMELTSSYICDVESNRKRPSLDMLERYSNALEVNRSMLLFFDEEGKKNNYNHQKMLLNILQLLETNKV